MLASACPRRVSALRSGQSPCCHGFPRSHVLLAHALWRGRSCVCVGVAAGLVVGVFARWVAGLRFFVFAVVFAWVVLALWLGGGAWLSRRPVPLLGVHMLVWAALACVVVLRAGLGGKWGGATMSRPMLRGAVHHTVCAWGEREREGGAREVVNTIPPFVLTYV